MNKIGRVFLAGLLALLPLLVTVFAIGWTISLLNSYLGPESWFGRQLVSLGVSMGSKAPYVIGLLLIVGMIYVLGLLVHSRAGGWFTQALDGLFGSIPVVSSVYDLTKRFTDIVDPKKHGGGITDMTPVWCFFGGEPGAAVLALQVAQKTVIIGDAEYLGIMIPSSPVPVGGALLYVPKDWVRPAADKMDDVMAVYVSMGVTPPKSISAEKV